MPQIVASEQDLHCLDMSPKLASGLKRVNMDSFSDYSEMFSASS